MSYAPFLIISPRLLILPTPSALHIRAYRDHYAQLYSLTSFCEIGFGDTYPARDWDEEARYKEIEKEVRRNWNSIGLGDMAVGLIEGKIDIDTARLGRRIASLDDNLELRVIEGNDYEKVIGDGKWLEDVEWVGYAGVRDARHGLPEPLEGELPLPNWKELTEVRYGIDPTHWGKGLATEAAKAVMSWAVAERSVLRFIAETQKENSRSGAVLQKMGFKESGTNYWQEPCYLEWERRIPQ